MSLCRSGPYLEHKKIPGNFTRINSFGAAACGVVNKAAPILRPTGYPALLETNSSTLGAGNQGDAEVPRRYACHRLRLRPLAGRSDEVDTVT